MADYPFFRQEAAAGQAAGEPVLLRSIQAIGEEFRGVPSHKRKPFERKHLKRMVHIVERVRGLEFYRTTANETHTEYILVCAGCQTPVAHLPIDPRASVVCSCCAWVFGEKEDIQAAGAWLDVEHRRMKRPLRTLE
ncbi:hypothetical protein [Devosia sp. SD17-2]|uniref:hypothetical protein n=1 Tax=Devosia sp. SD17-2 TaxID=2976459 RepID=UPI0023D84652|nr:hypothetical protein [Devosia sp. SD17-2]WEJ32191.1 hypothetical protein NYQ88_14955 [Devosia sp. SD17-2]